MSASNPILDEAVGAHRVGARATADRLCRNVLRQDPGNVGALQLVASLHAERGDALEAIRLLEDCLFHDPRNYSARYDLAVVSDQCGFTDTAIQEFKIAIELRPDFFRAYSRLATLYYRLGRTREAAALYREWSRVDPMNPEVLHMVAATSTHLAPRRCSETFIRTHFDGLASSFDRKLVHDLEYRGHELVAAALVAHRRPSVPAGDILDAGCGTGLCGPLLRSCCHRLVGVDLSGEMIERARRRGVYDELVQDELCRFLNAHGDTFLAVVAADVMIYFGALEEPLSSAHRALQHGGLLIATFEGLGSCGAAPYALEFHGRYSHRKEYICSVLSSHRFDVLSFETAVLRRELTQDVVGYVVVARKWES